MGLFDSLLELGSDIVTGSIDTVGGVVNDVANLDVTLSSTRQNLVESVKEVAEDTGDVIKDTINLDL